MSLEDGGWAEASVQLTPPDPPTVPLWQTEVAAYVQQQLDPLASEIASLRETLKEAERERW